MDVLPKMQQWEPLYFRPEETCTEFKLHYIVPKHMDYDQNHFTVRILCVHFLSHLYAV